MSGEKVPAVAFAESLLAVQASLPHFEKGATAKVPTKDGGSYSYDYADLTTITDAALPVLNKHGFTFICKPHLREDGNFVLRYVLLHEAGHSESGDYPLGNGGTAQQIGSAITYGRRYSLCAVTGIAPSGEDDDGARASQPAVPPHVSDPLWLASFDERVTAATTETDLAALDAEAKRKYHAKELTAEDAKGVKKAIDARRAELVTP